MFIIAHQQHGLSKRIFGMYGTIFSMAGILNRFVASSNAIQIIHSKTYQITEFLWKTLLISGENRFGDQFEECVYVFVVAVAVVDADADDDGGWCCCCCCRVHDN